MLNEEYRAALLAERANIEPHADGDPHKGRRLAEIDKQLGGGAEARAAHYEAEGTPPEVSETAVETAVEDTRSTTPLETAVTPKRGARNAKES